MLMSIRKLAYLIIGISVMICLCSFGISNAFETKYYNKVPYHALFQQHVKQVKVQKSENGKVVQAVVPVDKEDKTKKEVKGD
jgi:hypothetical protein